jgi:hypothetical protein
MAVYHVMVHQAVVQYHGRALSTVRQWNRLHISSLSQIFLKNMNNHLQINVQLILHKIWGVFTTSSLNFESFSAPGVLGGCPLFG